MWKFGSQIMFTIKVTYLMYLVSTIVIENGYI